MGDFFVPCCFGMSRAFLFHPGTLSFYYIKHVDGGLPQLSMLVQHCCSLPVFV